MTFALGMLAGIILLVAIIIAAFLWETRPSHPESIKARLRRLPTATMSRSDRPPIPMADEDYESMWQHTWEIPAGTIITANPAVAYADSMIDYESTNEDAARDAAYYQAHKDDPDEWGAAESTPDPDTRTRIAQALTLDHTLDRLSALPPTLEAPDAQPQSSTPDPR